ncbi:hypothetical protein N0824_02656 [Microcystis sp. 0824]|uniref:class I SAM-dependent methyltransferase n=1 Tax=Microcystis sp. 0824 TaxID=1502726 RepID=UPI000D0C219E|nr:methyltransferase domain-containing protein [Microcystis sp. 0824]GBF54788.1 hypothetical protein N0824_02656 [Microcystis sp. 0824]
MSKQQQHFCIVCNQEINPRLVMRSKNDNGDIMRCPHCRLTFVNPMPSEQAIQEYYNGLCRKESLEFDLQKQKWANTSLDGYIEELKRLKKWLRQDFLDLGGVLGYYAKEALTKGLKAILVDIDPISIEFSNKHQELPEVYQASIQEFSEISSDWIFLRHNIEHFKNPDNLLDTVYSLLSEGGVLTIETDNNAGAEILLHPKTMRFYQSLYSKKYEGSSPIDLLLKLPLAVDLLRHLFGFRADNLSQLLINDSFETVKTIHYCLGDSVYWPNIPNNTIYILIEKLTDFKIMSLLLEVVCLIIFPFRKMLNRLQMSSGLCIYATKKAT